MSNFRVLSGTLLVHNIIIIKEHLKYTDGERILMFYARSSYTENWNHGAGVGWSYESVNFHWKLRAFFQKSKFSIFFWNFLKILEKKILKKCTKFSLKTSCKKFKNRKLRISIFFENSWKSRASSNREVPRARARDATRRKKILKARCFLDLK